MYGTFLIQQSFSSCPWRVFNWNDDARRRELRIPANLTHGDTAGTVSCNAANLYRYMIRACTLGIMTMSERERPVEMCEISYVSERNVKMNNKGNYIFTIVRTLASSSVLICQVNPGARPLSKMNELLLTVNFSLVHVLLRNEIGAEEGAVKTEHLRILQ